MPLAAALLLSFALAARPVAVHPGPSVRLDASAAKYAIAYVETGDPEALESLAATPAVTHLLTHARFAERADVPRTSTRELALRLVTPRDVLAKRLPEARKVLAEFEGPLRRDLVWRDALKAAVPKDADVEIHLHLIFSDTLVGTASPGDASVDAGHPWLEAHPGALRYVALQECQKVVFLAYNPPRPLEARGTAADLLAEAEFHLALEGLAAWTALGLREREKALDDEDYRALSDEATMKRLEARYLEVHAELVKRAEGAGLADPLAKELYRGLQEDRLFARLGARAARHIERVEGRATVVKLVKAGPRAFFETWVRVRGGAR
ncbi:MAG: hypothetical protein U0229_08915 [Anaeromyxobacter sp.]